MKLNKKYIAITMILLAFTVACGKKKEPAVEEDNSRPVKVQVLENSGMSLGYTASGEIKGIEEIPYEATVGGTVTIVNAKNGDNVSAGRLIVAIDNQSGVSNANAANASYSQASINFEKYRELYAKRLITETEYLTAKTNLESARANLQIANDVRGKSSIIANKSGTIGNLNIEKYQQVNAGETLFTLINDSEMKLEVGVSPQVIDKIKVGATAKVKIEELNGEELEGVVYEVASSSNSSSKQFVVKVKIPNPNKKIKSGMYGTVNINTGMEQGIIVPKNAIVIRGVQQVVYIIKDGKAVMIPVNILNQNENSAAISGEGLTTGSQLIIDGQNVIQNDDAVRIVK